MAKIIQFPGKKAEPKAPDNTGKMGILLWPAVDVNGKKIPDGVSIPFKAEHGDLAMKALGGDADAFAELIKLAHEFPASDGPAPSGPEKEPA